MNCSSWFDWVLCNVYLYKSRLPTFFFLIVLIIIEANTCEFWLLYCAQAKFALTQNAGHPLENAILNYNCRRSQWEKRVTWFLRLITVWYIFLYCFNFSLKNIWGTKKLIEKWAWQEKDWTWKIEFDFRHSEQIKIGWFFSCPVKMHQFNDTLRTKGVFQLQNWLLYGFRLSINLIHWILGWVHFDEVIFYEFSQQFPWFFKGDCYHFLYRTRLEIDPPYCIIIKQTRKCAIVVFIRHILVNFLVNVSTIVWYRSVNANANGSAVALNAILIPLNQCIQQLMPINWWIWLLSEGRFKGTISRHCMRASFSFGKMQFSLAKNRFNQSTQTDRKTDSEWEVVKKNSSIILSAMECHIWFDRWWDAIVAKTVDDTVANCETIVKMLA